MSNSEIHGDGSSLSIEESNKLRLAIGLEPLQEDPKEEKKDFVHQPAINIGDKQRQEKLLKKLKDHCDDKLLREKLMKIPLLTDEPAPILNFDELADKAEKARRRKEQGSESEEEDIEEGEVYTEKDLSGLAVEHNPSRFNTFMPTILTLKDKNVLDKDDDTLVNVNMVDYEKFEQNVTNKKIGVHYNPEQCDDEGYVNEPRLLQKYDDKKKTRFVIDSAGKYDLTQDLQEQQVVSNLMGKRINLPEEEVKVANDYFTAEEIKQRLRMKKKRRATSARSNSKITTVKADINLEDIKPKKEEGELIEDDNNKNAQSKKMKNSNSKRSRAIIIKNLQESDEDEDNFRPILVFSEIKEQSMINTKLRDNLTSLKKKRSNISSDDTLLCVSEYNEDGDHAKPALTISTSCLNNEQIFSKLKAQQDSVALKANFVKEEPVIAPMKTIEVIQEVEEIEEQAQTSGWQPEDKLSSVRKVEKKKITKSSDTNPPLKKELKLTDGVLGDEVLLNKGIYSALLLAKTKGYLEIPREETKLSNPKNNLLKAQHFYEEKIRYEDIDSKAPRRERYSGPVSTFQDKKEYNPEIKLEYHDEFGRPQEPKEAFRTLSHRFHGKTSGKIKCEKRIKSYVKEMEQGTSVGDIAMKSVDKQYSKMKEEKKFCVALSGKNAIIPSSLKKTNKKGKSSPK